MEKTDKLGIKLSLYAVLAFVAVIFGQVLLCWAILGAAIFLIRDRWVTRQVTEALFLGMAGELVARVVTLFSPLSALPDLSDLASLYYSISAFAFFLAVVAFSVNLAVVVLSLFSLANLVCGKDACVTGITRLAARFFPDVTAGEV